MKKFAYIAFPAILFLLPILSFAHTPNVLQGGYWGQGLNPIVSCTAPIVIQKGYYSGNTFIPSITGTSSRPIPSNNPCLSLCDLIHTIFHIIAFGISLTLYLGVPVLFAWGGILIMASGGNPGRISEGKKVLTGTLIGLLITLFAYLIVKTLIDTLGINGLIPLTFQCVVR